MSGPLMGNGADNLVVDNGDGTQTLVTTGGTRPLAAGTALATGDFPGQDGGTVHGTAIMQVTSGLGVSAGSVQMQGSLDAPTGSTSARRRTPTRPAPSS